jgi:PIN domain nuclease of toxin-antitoxin system
VSDDQIVLDASALLALLNEEPGAGEVQAVISNAVVSSVNVAEVADKLADHGLSDANIQIALGIGFDTLPFGADEVSVMPKLRHATKPYGLSLGDRCCLATALVQKSPVLTADRVWAGVKVRGLKIIVLDDRAQVDPP